MKVLKVLEKRLRLIVFIILALLLGAVYQIYNKDAVAANNLGAPSRSGKLLQIPAPQPASMKIIQANLANRQNPIHQSSVNMLLSDSMFNAKTIKDAQAREAQAARLINSAEQLSNQKKYADAYKNVQEALKLQPGHIKAQNLKKKLETILNISED